MIRSFHYAAYTGLTEREDMYPGSSEILEPWAEHWYQIVVKQFLRGYLTKAGNASFIPVHQEQIEDLISLFLIEKAILETSRELHRRPDKTGIPLKGLEKIIQDFLSEEQ
jgi:maltose alpha-D-glucosyltransferase/alpha-amylase